MKTQGNMPLKVYSKNSLVTDFTPAQMKYTTKNILNGYLKVQWNPRENKLLNEIRKIIEIWSRNSAKRQIFKFVEMKT